MPSTADHINQWKRNRGLLLSNCLASYPEWKITVAFYCALHAVEALFAKRNYPQTKDHHARNRYLGDRQNKLPAIWNSYKPLFDASHDARYTCPIADKRFGVGVQKSLIQVSQQRVEADVLEGLAMERQEFPLIAVDDAGMIVLQPLQDGSTQS